MASNKITGTWKTVATVSFGDETQSLLQARTSGPMLFGRKVDVGPDGTTEGKAFLLSDAQLYQWQSLARCHR